MGQQVWSMKISPDIYSSSFTRRTVPVVTVFVFDREAGVPQVRVDRPEHIGRVEGLHPFALVA
jgi:hypothetical protein